MGCGSFTGTTIKLIQQPNTEQSKRNIPTIIVTQHIDPKHSESPTETQYSESPTETQYSESPTETQYSESPTETQYSESLTESQLSESLTESQLSESLTESRLSESPTESQLSESLTESQLSESLTESQLSESPTESQHSDSLSESQLSSRDTLGKQRYILPDGIDAGELQPFLSRDGTLKLYVKELCQSLGRLPQGRSAGVASLPPMTLDDLEEHNSHRHHQTYAYCFLNGEYRVINATAMYDFFKPVTDSLYESGRVRTKLSPGRGLACMLEYRYRIPKHLIQEAKQAFYIADDNPVKLLTDLIIDVKENDTVSNDCIKTLQRFLEQFIKNRGSPIKAKTFKGDANSMLVTLPQGVHVTDLRPNLTTYFNNNLPFDTSRTEIILRKPVFGKIGDLVDPFTIPWRSSFEPFDVSITGEAAWDVIETDLVKNEITTRAQDKLNARRAKWTRFYDKHRMKHRRIALAKYFMYKYGYTMEHMESYLEWGDRMETNQKQLRNVCRLKGRPIAPRYYKEDNCDVSTGGDIITSQERQRRKLAEMKRLKILKKMAKRYKYSREDLDRFMGWASDLEHSERQFKELCTS